MISAKIILVYLLQSINIVGLPVNIPNIDISEAYCLAENIYYEARNEDIRGQYAVAEVTINRMNNPAYPNTICGVVKQTATIKSTNKTVCAFSWYCTKDKGSNIPVTGKNGELNQAIIDQFQVASLIAINVLSGLSKDVTNGATHFNNPHESNPSWARTMEKTATIGNHVFYK